MENPTGTTAASQTDAQGERSSGAGTAATQPSSDGSVVYNDSPYRVDSTALSETRHAVAPKDSPDYLINSQGEMRHITPHDVKVNQFYPQVDLIIPKKGGKDKQKDVPPDGTTEQETKAIEGDVSSVSREPTEAKSVKFDSEVAETEGKELTLEAAGTQSDFASTAISLARTATGTTEGATDGEAEQDGSVDGEVFSTQVGEDILAAARQRQRVKSILVPKQQEHIVITANDILDRKAEEHYTEALQCMERQDFPLAVVSLNKALNLKPTLVLYYLQRAECYLQMADFQAAILNYKKVCVLDPDNYQYYARLAFIYYLQGQCLFDQRLFPEALEGFSRAAEMRPEVVGYHTRSIACLAALQRHGECLALVNKRLETEHENADLYVMRARLHELFRNTTLCYYDVKDAMSLDPDHAEGCRLMVRLQERSKELYQHAMQLNLAGRHRDALQKVSIAIETNPSIADYHVFRGALHRRLGDFNAAIDDYLLALDKTDHNEESSVYLEAHRQLLLTYNDFAVECFTKGFYEEAILLLNKAIKGEKREKGLYINRGDCFYRQGEVPFALQDYHQALELDPYDSAICARISIIHNEKAVQDYQDKVYSDAEAGFTLAIQFNPKVGQYYLSRARARQMLENLSSARQDLMMALLLDPSNEEILSLLARLFPGKSLKDVLHSYAAEQARRTLEELQIDVPSLSRLGSGKLKPLSGKSRLSSGGGTPERSMSGFHSISFLDFNDFARDKQFNSKIATKKKKVPTATLR